MMGQDEISMYHDEIAAKDTADLLAMRATIDDVLAKRKADLEAELASLGAVKPKRTRKPRSDKGTARKGDGQP